MLREPVGKVIWTAFAISLVAIAAGSVVAFRLMRGKPVAPGELLWLILGAGQLVYLIAFMSTYTYNLLAYVPDEPVLYWFLPHLAATTACAAAVFVFLRTAPLWASLYAVCLTMLALVTLDAWTPQMDRMPEESFLTLVAPVVLAITGGAAIVASLVGTYPGWPGRRLAHWTRIAMSFVPLAWFLFGYAQGWVFARELFVRYRD